MCAQKCENTGCLHMTKCKYNTILLSHTLQMISICNILIFYIVNSTAKLVRLHMVPIGMIYQEIELFIL